MNLLKLVAYQYILPPPLLPDAEFVYVFCGIILDHTTAYICPFVIEKYSEHLYIQFRTYVCAKIWTIVKPFRKMFFVIKSNLFLSVNNLPNPKMSVHNTFNKNHYMFDANLFIIFKICHF